MIQVVDHNTKELVLKQPLSVYHGSGNAIVLYVREDALRDIREHLNPKDISIKVVLINDTQYKQEVYVSDIWVNKKAIGADGGILVVPPSAKAELELSDVAVSSLLNSGMESVGTYPLE
ncbi:hypothetical protein NVP1244A_014 [Vibrio phage 1.244.A._10N.261.54.C3]|nr:hypothetical protein NVP1244A_014 [Vibrio phage 1.244.A._10N.261.54.C3]AUR98642.1 hypothetical protein NVP1255O_014 [Vibrio phage 1.255.O._10N.286.45.F1]